MSLDAFRPPADYSNLYTEPSPKEKVLLMDRESSEETKAAVGCLIGAGAAVAMGAFFRARHTPFKNRRISR